MVAISRYLLVWSEKCFYTRRIFVNNINIIKTLIIIIDHFIKLDRLYGISVTVKRITALVSNGKNRATQWKNFTQSIIVGSHYLINHYQTLTFTTKMLYVIRDKTVEMLNVWSINEKYVIVSIIKNNIQPSFAYCLLLKYIRTAVNFCKSTLHSTR